MKRLLILCFCLALIAVPVRAQQLPTLSSLEISLWPEYDRPSVLVIYRGEFAAGTPLPVPVEFRIPASAGQPHAVAYVDKGGQRLNQPYTTRVEGDSLVVSFDLAALSFQLEYYLPLQADASGLRDLPFSYTADYAVDALSLEVQEPPTAQAFSMDPPADSTVQGSDGLTYELNDAGSLAQGETRAWTITYQKAGSGLTADSPASTGSSTQATTPAAPGSDNSTIIIFVLSFIALVAVGAGAFWLGKQTQPASQSAAQSPAQKRRRGNGRGSQPRPAARSSHGETVYCYRCGATLRPDSEFCHKCGAEVRQ
jgi:hypothetical protein